jgi:hypothetical protein
MLAELIACMERKVRYDFFIMKRDAGKPFNSIQPSFGLPYSSNVGCIGFPNERQDIFQIGHDDKLLSFAEALAID